MRRVRQLFALSLILGLLIATKSQAAAVAPRTLTRRQDPIQVPGDLLKNFHGAALDQLRLYALVKGAMTPVIYQWDERKPGGDFVFMLGEEADPEDANHLLDPQDLLVFRVQEAGDRAAPADWPAGAKAAIEIELSDPLDQGKAWVYLFRFEGPAPAPRAEDTIRLLHWDPWKKSEYPFVVESDYFHFEGRVNTVRGKTYKTAVNQVWQTPISAGGTNQNLLDSQKMRAWVELFFGKFKIEANETDMIGGIAAITQGRVRGFGRQWLTVSLPFGLKAPRIYSDVITYDRVIVSPMCLSIPFNPEAIITRSGMFFGYDLNPAAFGMRFYSPNCLEGVTIDGKMSAKEKALSQELVPWFCITGPQGTMIFRAVIDPKLLEQTEHRLLYFDDLTASIPPEKLPGAIGYAQTTIEVKSVQPGRYPFLIQWYFPDHFYRPEGLNLPLLQEYLNIEDHPLEIRIEDRQVKNSALHPPPLLTSK
jgi:hypothetical protein